MISRFICYFHHINNIQHGYNGQHVTGGLLPSLFIWFGRKGGEMEEKTTQKRGNRMAFLLHYVCGDWIGLYVQLNIGIVFTSSTILRL